MATVLGGCALPAAAPTSRELVETKSVPDFPYALVNVDSRVAHLLRQNQGSFGAALRRMRYVPNNTLRPGDTVAITIYETGGSSLFPMAGSAAPVVSAALSTSGSTGSTSSSGSASSNTVPAQIIEADGTISVPFVGRVKAAGLTPGQIGAMLERELRQKAVAPQVVVTSSNATTNSATVSGDVNAPRLVPLSLRGERLLDAIAYAGGSKFAPYETYVSVMRDGQVGTMLLQAVLTNPQENIVIRPNDQINLIRNPRTYVVMGATQRPALFPFDREKVSLAEAIAQAGGPIDAIGDPAGIYLFRFEPLHIARQIMGPDNLAVTFDPAPEFVPVLYRVGLRDAEGYFLAQAMQIRDKDVVLVTNAEATQLQKLLVLIRGFTGIAYDLKRYAVN